MFCPKCGSWNIDVSIHQENSGSKTLTTTKSKYKEVGHGCLWWLCIGWWWWIVDLFLWILLFFPRLAMQLFKKKKYEGLSNATSETKNKFTYRSICLCKDCGYHWET